MLNLILKDVKNIVYDKKTLAVILLMPIVLMSILGTALKGAFSSENSGVTDISIAIVKEYDYDNEYEKFLGMLESDAMGDMDSSSIDLEEINPEKIFFNEFLGNEDIKNIISYQIVDLAEGEKLMNDDEISALVILPKDFVYNSFINMTLPFRNTITIQTLKNSNNQFSADIIELILNQYVQMMNKIVVHKMVATDVIIENGLGYEAFDRIADLMTNQLGQSVPITTKEVTGKEILDSFQYYAVAIMTMFLLYAASIGGKALLEEKNEFTLQRLEVSGLSISKIAISNFIRVILIAILQSTIMILFSRVVMGVEWGGLLTILVAMLSSAFAVGGLSALVAVLTLVTDRYFIANVFEFAVVNLMALVGGSFIPVEVLPKALQKLNIIAINGNAIRIYLNGMSDLPLSESTMYIAALLIMGVVFMVGAGIVLKTKKGGVIA